MPTGAWRSDGVCCGRKRRGGGAWQAQPAGWSSRSPHLSPTRSSPPQAPAAAAAPPPFCAALCGRAGRRAQRAGGVSWRDNEAGLPASNGRNRLAAWQQARPDHADRRQQSWRRLRLQLPPPPLLRALCPHTCCVCRHPWRASLPLPSPPFSTTIRGPCWLLPGPSCGRRSSSRGAPAGSSGTRASAGAAAWIDPHGSHAEPEPPCNRAWACRAPQNSSRFGWLISRPQYTHALGLLAAEAGPGSSPAPPPPRRRTLPPAPSHPPIHPRPSIHLHDVLGHPPGFSQQVVPVCRDARRIF